MATINSKDLTDRNQVFLLRLLPSLLLVCLEAYRIPRMVCPNDINPGSSTDNTSLPSPNNCSKVTPFGIRQSLSAVHGEKMPTWES
eukprot:m.64255 g.64255  ORF g.64255 m.64255 type:complete len:86 (+) comp13484_c0_seq1:601-858(+)